jgi:D-alanyl-D-alanine-carboxypeptidase/D-alanyl-D-alanine-endopeptidase
MIPAVRIICFTVLLSAFSFRATAEDFTNAICAFLQHRGEVEKTPGAIVIGIVDEHGSSVISYGKLDNGTEGKVNGDTVFNIYSGTCCFTALLLQDMVERGEMRLDDPVADYLPRTVKMPTHNGRQITLRHLVTETAGFPYNDENLKYIGPIRADNPFADFTGEQMDAFVSNYHLTCDPGSVHLHGSVAMGLLGQTIALRAGTNYESLLVERICRPLKMDSTRITLTPELGSRLAAAYPTQFGYALPPLEMGALAPLCGLCSTANDLLKFIAANLGLTRSPLPLLMEKMIADFPDKAKTERETGIFDFGGGDFFASHYSGFDERKRRGVVVLSSSGNGLYNAANIGRFLLKDCQWQSDCRPKETHIPSQLYDSYVGQYRLTSNAMPSRFRFWPFSRRRDKTNFRPGIGVRCEGHRLFIQAITSGPSPTNEWLPPLPLELLPQLENHFFERLSGIPVFFSRDAQGKVTGLTMDYEGKASSYEKISDQSPKAPVPVKRPVIVELSPKLLDGCVGHYEQAPDARFPAGVKTAIWREEKQMFWRESGMNVPEGIFEIFPESETNFFDKVICEQLTFIKNDKGETTAVTFQAINRPDMIQAKKLKN